ncbi:nucleotidyltransferase domain-containing protein [bacterium]|nr:nucleotidyltransferase domain-containing protein [bacterium]
MVTMKMIKKLSAKIVKEFQPERIILLGSYAYGNSTENSDLDILIILPFTGKPFRKSLEILDKIDPDFAVDLLARRPEDVKRQYEEGDPLIREALDQGILNEIFNCA